MINPKNTTYMTILEHSKIILLITLDQSSSFQTSSSHLISSPLFLQQATFILMFQTYSPQKHLLLPSCILLFIADDLDHSLNTTLD